MYDMDSYLASADFLRQRLNGLAPEILIILGSTLGGIADQVRTPVSIPYTEIPHFRVSSAPGHAGRLLGGFLGDKPVLLMQGRLHTYEGYTQNEVAYPVRVAKLLGIDKLVLTNASGGINESYRPGDLMVITDHIQFCQTNALTGPNLEALGPRFPVMNDVYDKEYIRLFRQVAQAAGSLAVHEGLYFFASGPQYETPGEIRAMRLLGADAVGMSTVPEAMAAAHASMRTLGVSLVVNMAAGIETTIDHDEIFRVGAAAGEALALLLVDFVQRI